MAKELYYIDTCIWLNLINKEGDPTKGVPYWKIAEDFIIKNIELDNQLYYSAVVLREIQVKCDFQKYTKVRQFFQNLKEISKIDVLDVDKRLARLLESRYSFSISYYDLVHLIISKRVGAILITRDKQLIEIALENNVKAAMPEQIINY